MSEIVQVFVVMSGQYSDRGIESVWLTREEAETATGEEYDIEVWPIGEHKRTLGQFHRRCNVDPVTGEASGEYTQDDDGSGYAHLHHGKATADVLWWEGTLNNGRFAVQVYADTRERCDKVFAETLARVKADVSMGLPPEAIATRILGPSGWRDR